MHLIACWSLSTDVSAPKKIGLFASAIAFDLLGSTE
jgi:hypothetical protein